MEAMGAVHEVIDRLQELERRVKLLEDRLGLYQLLATYGPAVDSGSAAVVASLWTEQGTYDSTPAYPVVMQGRAALEAMVTSDQHQSYLRQGCGHLLGLPHLTFDGDTAVATGHAQLLLRDSDDDSFRVWRLTANRWEFVRGEDGWRVTRRTNRLLDGTPEARELLHQGLTPDA